MRKTLLKNLTVLTVFSLFINFSFGQIQGVTYTAKGITKSMADIIAYEKAYPVPVNYATAIRHDNEGPTNKVPNPNALPAPKNGFTPNGANSVTATQTVKSNFLSIWGSYAGVAGNESPYTPPDNVGEVGTTQVIACANCRMKVFTKPTATAAALTTPTGSSTTTLTSVLNVSLNTFFTIASIGVNSISDPHVRFDRLTQRWFVIAIDVNHGTNNYCIIAVSNGPTVTAASNFTFYYFRPSTTGGSASDFYDYPTLGIDKTSLLIGGNMFPSSFAGCNMWVVNKANLIAGTLTVTGFSHGTTGTNMFTPQGVQNDDPSYSESYFIGTSQTTNSKLVMRRVTYPGGVPTISSDITINTITTAAPMSPPSKGGTALDQDDDRPFAAMVKKNKIDGSFSLWTAHHSRINSSGVGSGSGDRDGSVWFQLGTLTATPSILQSGTVYDGTASVVSMIYPSVAMSGQGHTVMALTTTGSNKY